MDDLDRQLAEGSIEKRKYDEIKAAQAAATQKQANSPKPAESSAEDDQ